MKLSLIKFHLYTFEIISFLITVWVLCTLLFYALIFRFLSGIQKKNLQVAEITFNMYLNPKISSDVKFDIVSLELKNITSRTPPLTDPKKAFIYINKKKFTNKNSTYIQQYLNREETLEHCFLFKDYSSAYNARGVLSDLDKSSSDSWNMIIFVLISVFFLFLKLNMFKINISAIKNMRKEKYIPILMIRKYFFSYVIFHLSIIFIIPMLYRHFTDYKVQTCFGFETNYFNSFFYDRTFLWEVDSTDFQIFTEVYKNSEINRFLTEKNNMFFLHSPYILKESATASSYMLNILFFCVMVWISGIFIRQVFDKESECSIEEERYSKTKIIKLIYSAVLIIVWSWFFLHGFLSFLDAFYFYHRLIWHNFLKILDWKITSFLLIYYLHFYIYFYLIVFTVVSKLKLKRRSVCHQKLLTTPFSNRITSDFNEGSCSIEEEHNINGTTWVNKQNICLGENDE